MHEVVISVQNLHKAFGDFTAVNGIDFELHKGEILGFLGPNGAGKTTTIQMLLGAMSPSSGKISYFGKDLFQNRSEILERVNFSSTYTNLPWHLSVKQVLTYTSYLYKIKDRKSAVERVISDFSLQKLLNQKIKNLSAGQSTRLNLAKAFLNDPEVLLLDEPTASLDPDIAAYVRHFIQKQRDKDVSIVFTSHNMPEVEEICDRVIFINNGKIVANDTPRNLAKQIDSVSVELLLANKLSTEIESHLLSPYEYKLVGEKLIVKMKENQIPAFLQSLVVSGAVYHEISINKPTLQDYFLMLSKDNKTK